VAFSKNKFAGERKKLKEKERNIREKK